jgi:hypothetical protein
VAIKGKSKPKARRSVTRGPRPVYVPVRQPLVRRRGFQIAVVAIILLSAAGAVVYGYVHERNANHAAEQKAVLKSIASQYTTRVQTAIAGVGQSQGGVAFTLLPDLKTQIEALRSGSAPPADVAKAAGGLEEQATTAADGLSKIDPADLVRGKGVENAAFVRDLLNANVKMQNALRMDAVAAGVLAQAAGAPAKEAAALLRRADEARTTAETLFESGYSDWTNAQYTAGIFQPTPPAAGLPPGGQP